MSSHEVMALVTEALRDQLRAVLPPEAALIIGPPSSGVHSAPGLFVHLFRIAVSSSSRNRLQPVDRTPDGSMLAPPLCLELDYLIAGLGAKALTELALLDGVLQFVNDSSMQTHDMLEESLFYLERRSLLSQGKLSLRWLLLDLPLDQLSGVWLASGLPQRAGVIVRGEVVWQVQSSHVIATKIESIRSAEQEEG